MTTLAMESPDSESVAVDLVGRVVRTASCLTIVGAIVWGFSRHSWVSAMSLTAAGAVAIINFRWLEVVVSRVVQPDAPRFDRRSIVVIAGRMALLAAVMAALLWVPRIDFVGVALGFSALVGALVVEGARTIRSGGG
jgi:hypothetical protein